MNEPLPASTERQFPCTACGANLVFAPGTRSLECPYCGTRNEVPPDDATAVREAVRELDYAAHADRIPAEDAAEALTVRCVTCGAEQAFPPNVVARRCAFCGAALVAQAQSRRVIKPTAVLPFHVTRGQADGLFQQWIAGLWFAPNALRRQARREGVHGVYVPAWTYDADTFTRYTGERGEDYWVTETYTTVVNGRAVRQTRQVRRTRWYSARGAVDLSFDDVLVLATRTLPEYADELEPWDLKNLAPYRDAYLAGFVAESYQVALPEGFEEAKQIMAGRIAGAVRRDIGGDHQRIHSLDTRYDHVMFKLVLLPVWISAYRYGGRTYRFLVNARTGEIQGERPYSWVKITLAVLLGIILIVLFGLIIQGGRL
jgi:predicted RNA-binding Zn-ribbon protein involved in translation (DUF1610 family)